MQAGHEGAEKTFRKLGGTRLELLQVKIQLTVITVLDNRRKFKKDKLKLQATY